MNARLPQPALPSTAHSLPDLKHLRPDVWRKVNRLLVRKAISEFAHEALLDPLLLADDGQWQRYRLESDDGRSTYVFRAQRLALNHWLVEPDSIRRQRDGQTVDPDALAFIIEFRDSLQMRQDVIPLYLDEISSTLFGSAFKHHRKAPSARELVHAEFQQIETAMTEGHPGFVANNGRIGFDAADYPLYAPEAATPQHVVWLAVHKSRATLSISSGLSYQTLLDEELGADGVTRHRSLLLAEGVAPEDYLLMPAHAWQWHNRLAMFFAADIAQRMIICLGLSADEYLAQQSIRTFFNISAPHKRYVKTSLSVLNMGFMRGLSPHYMLATPAINDQVKVMVAGDPYLKGKGFDILREVAAIGYRNPYYEAGIKENNAYKKMLSCLWRESPLPKLQEGERLMTMTALLHTDNEGQSLLVALIDASGLSVEAWVDAYLDVYLSPLLHCFFRHDLVFMPHGENLILVMHGHRPVRALMKDIAEEVAIFDTQAVLPEAVQRMAVDVPAHMRTLSLFIDVFEGYLRHMAAILHQHAGYIDANFWQRVAMCVHRYQAEHPDLKAKFDQDNLFAEDFAHSCLNRLQIANNQHMLNLEDPAASLQLAGRLANPLAVWRDAEAIRT